jgi:hypothetical protein
MKRTVEDKERTGSKQGENWGGQEDNKRGTEANKVAKKRTKEDMDRQGEDRGETWEKQREDKDRRGG